MIGKGRQIKCMEQIKNTEQNTGYKMSIKQKWEKIISFLDSEIKVKEEVLLLGKFQPEINDSSKTNDGDDQRKTYNCSNETKIAKCVICGEKLSCSNSDQKKEGYSLITLRVQNSWK